MSSPSPLSKGKLPLSPGSANLCRSARDVGWSMRSSNQRAQDRLALFASHAPMTTLRGSPWKFLELRTRPFDSQGRRLGRPPGIHNSNGRGREGCINRCGNSVVRYTLIEMVWRMTRWQPDYPPIKKLHTMVSKRGKRRLVVAAARRLAIDLWRWATGRATAQELGLQLQPTMTQKPSV